MTTVTSVEPFPPPARALNRPLSIVVADDVVELPPIIREWLRRDGHEIHCVFSGREVIELLKRGPVDLVITDVLMPDGDGLEVIMEEKALQPGIRILAISGGGQLMPALDCLKLAGAMGAHAVLLKPFTRPQLMDGMRRALA